MKWVRRTLLALTILPMAVVVGLLVAGQRQGAGRNLEQVEIRCPPGQVFRYLEDERLVKRWTGLAEITPLTEGGLRVGARSRIALEARGQQTEMEGEVTALDRDRYLALVVRSAPGAEVGFRQTVEYRLEPTRRGTRLRVTADTHYEGLILRLLEPLITRAAQKNLELNLDRLKAQAETDPGPRVEPLSAISSGK